VFAASHHSSTRQQRRARTTSRLIERRRARSRGFSDGRYWARTSDPQLVDHVRRFAVCGQRTPLPVFSLDRSQLSSRQPPPDGTPPFHVFSARLFSQNTKIARFYSQPNRSRRGEPFRHAGLEFESVECPLRETKRVARHPNLWISPPSTTSSIPVMYRASSEARKSAACATSQAVPMWPIGTCSSRASHIASRSPSP
jgi:hypothetical protein